MMNFLIDGANMIIKPKRQKPGQNYGFNQNQQPNQQGGWGQQNQQGGLGQQYQQGGWGQQQGSNQQGGGWGQQNYGNQGWGGNTGGGGWQGQTINYGLGVLNQNSQQQWGNHLQGGQWVQQQKKLNEFNIISQQQGTVDINKFIGQQVVFIQPSPTQKKLEQLKRQGRPFIDQLFTASQTSLHGQYPNDGSWKSISWKKTTQVIQNPKIFVGKVQPGDIKQGYLGDCYFLAGLAALAERPDRIFNLFLLQELNQQKYFSVKMLYKGKWMTIDIDEYIPWMGNQPAFSKSVSSQLWVVLLEKAWAKLYTSYKRIEAGYPEQPLHDLTGAPIRQIVLKGGTFNKQQQWQYLLEASRRQYSMVASSNPGSDTNKSVSGVVQGHAYTVLNAVVLRFQGRQQRIVQLRNPWGKGQFTGKWSDQDQNWNYVPQQEKQRIGFNPNKEDGIFWMPYDNFVAQFRAISVAEIDDNASYIYKSTKDRACKGVYFSIEIAKQGVYSLHVDKTPERIYPQKHQDLFQYPQALIQIGRLQGNSCQKFQGLRSAKRTLFQKQQLTPGKYVAFVRISYNKDFENQFDVNLAVYAPYACNIKLATQQQAAIFTGNPNVDWTNKQEQPSTPWNTMGNINTGGNNNFDSQFGNNQGGWGGQQTNIGGQGQGGWGGQQINYGGQGGQGGQGGWGNQGSNQGWQNQGNQGGWSNQGNQGGWSNQGNQGGWSNQGNNGWGTGQNNNGSGGQGW